jgi:biopolymer transport protein ExbB/biopolymer transport protein TolQ
MISAAPVALLSLLQAPAAEGAGLSYLELWQSMGLFAKSIVVVMLVMSLWYWTISISKYLQLRRSQRETRKFAPEFSRYLQEEQLDAAIQLAEKNKKSHVARVLGDALQEVKPLLRDRATITAADINSAERAVERQMLIITSELKRGLGVLATTGATAPFVGLLGTTMGIVTAFQGMSASGGSGSLAAITGGVAEALITTAFGLMVAIPAVWLYNYFSTKIDFISVEMTYTSKELIDYLIKSVGSEFGRSIFTKEFQAQKATQTSGPISR